MSSFFDVIDEDLDRIIENDEENVFIKSSLKEVNINYPMRCNSLTLEIYKNLIVRKPIIIKNKLEIKSLKNIKFEDEGKIILLHPISQDELNNFSSNAFIEFMKHIEIPEYIRNPIDYFAVAINDGNVSTFDFNFSYLGNLHFKMVFDKGFLKKNSKIIIKNIKENKTEDIFTGVVLEFLNEYPIDLIKIQDCKQNMNIKFTHTDIQVNKINIKNVPEINILSHMFSLYREDKIKEINVENVKKIEIDSMLLYKNLKINLKNVAFINITNRIDNYYKYIEEFLENNQFKNTYIILESKLKDENKLKEIANKTNNKIILNLAKHLDQYFVSDNEKEIEKVFEKFLVFLKDFIGKKNIFVLLSKRENILQRVKLFIDKFYFKDEHFIFSCDGIKDKKVFEKIIGFLQMKNFILEEVE